MISKNLYVLTPVEQQELSACWLPDGEMPCVEETVDVLVSCEMSISYEETEEN